MRQVLFFRRLKAQLICILAELVFALWRFVRAGEKVIIQGVDKLISLQLLLLSGIYVDEHGDHSLLIILLGLRLGGPADRCAVLLEPLNGLAVVSWG